MPVSGFRTVWTSRPLIYCSSLVALSFTAVFLMPVATTASPDRPVLLSPAATEVRITHDTNRLHVTSTDHGRLFSLDPPAILYDSDSFVYRGTLLIGAIMPDGQPRVVNGSGVELTPENGPAGRYHDFVRDLAGGNRPGFGKNPDDDKDGRTDEDDLNGLDDDGDGRVDEDYQGYGDRMWVVTMRDAVANDYTPYSAVPGLQVRQKVIQWSTSGFETLVAIECEIRNIGQNNLRDVHVGLMADVDVGPLEHSLFWIDDLVGSSVFDTTIATADPGCPGEPLSIPVVWGRDVPDNGTTIDGGDTPRSVGFLFLDHPTDPAGITAPSRVGLRNFSYYSGGQLPGVWPPRTDAEFYSIMSNPEIRRDANKPDDYQLYFGVGPFSKLDPGETMTVTIGIVVGEDPLDLRRRVFNAQVAFNGRCVDQDSDALTGVGGREARVPWAVDLPPTPPASNVGPPDPEDQAQFAAAADDRRVVLQWNDLSERYPDPTGAVQFEGYQVWRVDDWRRSEFSDRPAPGEWKLVDTYRLNPRDGLGVDSPQHLDRIRSGPGLYEWSQTDVQNGRLYYYAVTALGTTWRWAPEAEQFLAHDVPGIPSSAQELLVMPAWAEGAGCDDVKVVPNPYRAGAPWDLASSDCDPSGSRLALRSLPENWRRLDIFTLTGDRVFTGRPGQSQVAGGCEVRAGDAGGTFIWDLRNEGGDPVEAGIYMYVVDTPERLCRGHFVIIR